MRRDGPAAVYVCDITTAAVYVLGRAASSAPSGGSLQGMGQTQREMAPEQLEGYSSPV